MHDICQECDYKKHQNSHLKEHIQSKHGGVKHPCQECDFPSIILKSSLGKHIQSVHKGIKYLCQNCYTKQHEMPPFKNIFNQNIQQNNLIL